MLMVSRSNTLQGPERQLVGSGESEPWRHLIPLARFSNKFQMKSVRLLSNIIFGDSQTGFVPIYCPSSWIILLPEAQSDAFSVAHSGCRLRGSQLMARVRPTLKAPRPATLLPQVQREGPRQQGSRTGCSVLPSCPPPSWAPHSSQPGDDEVGPVKESVAPILPPFLVSGCPHPV